MSLSPLAVVGITRYHQPATGYTPIRDSFLRDARTSLRAFRVGAYVLSHAAGFIQTQAQIARACGLAVTTVRAALEDLEKDRYLARRVIREHGRVVGTAYAISDRPFTDEELAQLCPPCTESVHRESVHTESVPPKKTTPVRETTSPSKTSPPGAPAGGSIPASSTEEEPMARQPAPPTLDLEFAPARPRQNGKTTASKTAQAVVAAYVDAYRQHHSGGDPIRRDIGRVARDAATLLVEGRAGVDELTSAAAAMGATAYANLGVQLNIYRQRGRRTVAKIAPVAPRGSFDTAHAATQAQFIADLKADPELASWVADDPAEVAKLIQQDPDLAVVFARVNAA